MKIMKRWLTITAGLFVLLLGLVVFPIPGPGGTPIILAGLAILSVEIAFVRRLREKARSFHAKHYSQAAPWKRRALVAGILVGSVIMSCTSWWFWNSRLDS